MRTFAKFVGAGLLFFLALQLVRPSIPTKPATSEAPFPPEVRRILEKDCYSCHSDERRLAWFDQIVPGYWLVRHDILMARRHLNFSTLGTKPPAAQKATLYEAVNMIQLGAMPLPKFLALHPDAKVDSAELTTLKAYLAPWATPLAPATPSAPGVEPAASLSTVPPDLNGLPFQPDFENWRPLSTTDRGDNATFRLVLGNDIAVKAAATGEISPWPDGTRFAKIAWQQQAAPDGLIYPGSFVQVEFMVKDDQRYKDSEGWGWGRWRGLDLKPYGNDAQFVNECTGCHAPVAGDDFVYSLPITPAKANHAEVVNNNAAALPPGLPFAPLGWNAITMYVDPKTVTTATLYGNDVAMKAVQAKTNSQDPPRYSPGAVLALVTWAQREDPHWFGARIPDTVRSIELVQVNDAGLANTYQFFPGTEIGEQHFSGGAAERQQFILGLRAARLP